MNDDLADLIVDAVGEERDPYPHFAEHRRADPVALEEGFAGDTVYTVFRYADVEAVLQDPTSFDSSVYAKEIGMVLGPSILQMDGPQHVRHRALIGGTFRRVAVEALREPLMQPIVDGLIDGLIDGMATRGRAELVRQFTIRYPIQIIAELLGIPREDYPRFTRLSIQLISIASEIERGLQASIALREYFAGILAERRAAPRDDLISQLAMAELEGAPVPDDEIFAFLRLLLPAGAETTYRLLGNLLFGLLSNPDQLAAVRENRTLLPRAIEEALRWEAPVQYISRRALREATIAGVTIPMGSHVSLSLGSANHDDTVFVDPGRFELFAERAAHLAFAEGPHRCLGEHLARAETTVAMNALLDRLEDLRLDPEGGEAFVQGNAFRSPNKLPVLFSR
jgi:cytochrome P450